MGVRRTWQEVHGTRVKESTCFLRPDDEKLRESITGLLFGPNVLVPFVFTGILEQTGQPGWDHAALLSPLQPKQTRREATLLGKDPACLQVCGAPLTEPQRGETPSVSSIACSKGTCHSGSFSSEKIWKYFCASCIGGNVCSFKLVQELRNRTRCLKVYKPRRSLP